MKAEEVEQWLADNLPELGGVVETTESGAVKVAFCLRANIQGQPDEDEQALRRCMEKLLHQLIGRTFVWAHGLRRPKKENHTIALPTLGQVMRAGNGSAG